VVFVKARLMFETVRPNCRHEAASHGSALFGFGVDLEPVAHLGVLLRSSFTAQRRGHATPPAARLEGSGEAPGPCSSVSGDGACAGALIWLLIFVEHLCMIRLNRILDHALCICVHGRSDTGIASGRHHTDVIRQDVARLDTRIADQ
jgi:hypothetical protein